MCRLWRRLVAALIDWPNLPIAQLYHFSAPAGLCVLQFPHRAPLPVLILQGHFSHRRISATHFTSLLLLRPVRIYRFTISPISAPIGFPIIPFFYRVSASTGRTVFNAPTGLAGGLADARAVSLMSALIDSFPRSAPPWFAHRLIRRCADCFVGRFRF